MTGPALLRTILASPDDDAPRLVLADWLDEHGEPERAEFIRVQVELARTKHNHRHQGFGGERCRACPLQKREYDLLASNADRWFPEPLSPRALTVRRDTFEERDRHPDSAGPIGLLRRGFAEAWRGTAADWLAHGDALAWDPAGARPCPPTAQPVGEVRLTTRPEIRQGGCLRWTEPEADGGVRLYAQWDVAVGGRVEQQNLRVCLACEYAADLGAREQFDRKVDAARTPEGYFAARWPAVKTWHLPPEPQAATIDEVRRWTMEDAERAMRVLAGDPDAPVPLGVMDVEERRASSAAPDARRRAGHSRMPGWLVEQRGQRPPRR